MEYPTSDEEENSDDDIYNGEYFGEDFDDYEGGIGYGSDGDYGGIQEDDNGFLYIPGW